MIILLTFLLAFINYILIIPFAYAYDENHKHLWYRAFFFLKPRHKFFIVKYNFHFGIIGFIIATILISENEFLLKRSNMLKCPLCTKDSNVNSISEKEDLSYYSNYYCNNCKSTFTYNFVYDNITKFSNTNLTILWHNYYYRVYIGDFYNIKDKLFESESFDKSLEFFRKYNNNLIFV